MPFKVFVNATKEISVESDFVQNALITVYNAMGQKLVSTSNTGTKTVIAKSFTSGIYIVTLNVGGKVVSQKICIN
jgi:hypothetical protein